MARSDVQERERALALRSEGESIRAIADQLDVPRSTLGGWLRGIGRSVSGGFLGECGWCGDLFFTTHPRRRHCCREHTVDAAHAAARERGTR